MLIYKITNTVNDRVYIGQTRNSLNKRWYAHLERCRAGENKPLYNAMNKYGIDSFNIICIDKAETIDELNAKEQSYIKEYNTLFPNGYNLQSGGLNYTVCEHTKKKISEAKSGVKYPNRKRVKLSESHKKNIGISIKNSFTYLTSIKSPERSKKLSESLRGKSFSEEHKKNLKENHKGNTGKTFNDEHKRKIGETNKRIQLLIKCKKIMEEANL